MKFTKMHGLGNDYVFVIAMDQPVERRSCVARAVSDRHTGIGSDGLIFIDASDVADVRMEMYNADGSRAQMCGNGIRCVAKLAVEHGLTAGPVVRVETDAGVKRAECRLVAGVVRSVRVDMGPPSLTATSLPAAVPVDRLVNYRLEVAGLETVMTCVSMGNPHAVIFVDDLDAVNLHDLGPKIERAAIFPERINVHFVRLDSTDHVTMRSWERGSGATRACGTGACAVCVAGVITERTKRRMIATLPGGDLDLEWCDETSVAASGPEARVADHVYMIGPAVEVFTGDWPDLSRSPKIGLAPVRS